MSPVDRDLVLLGGGHAHVGVLKSFGMSPPTGVRLTLISPAGVTPYSGMLPGLVAGHYRFEEAHLELPALCRFAGAQFYQATVTGLDPVRRRLHLDGRPPVAFDLLSINTGSTPRLDTVPGAAEFAVPVKPVAVFLEGLDGMLARARETARSGGTFRVVVVGGGAGGVELLLAIRHRLRRESAATGLDFGRFHFEVVSASTRVPAGHSPAVQRILARILARQGVVVHAGSPVTRVEAGRLRCAEGAAIPFDALFWVTQAAPPSWISASGLATTGDGFLSVTACLQSTSHPCVFGAGDVATVAGHPRSKSGVFAVRQGAPLGGNLRRALAGEPLRPFVPQHRFLSLISTGERSAVASWGPLACTGTWVWRLKDRIDRGWMRQYQELPGMPAKPLPIPAATGGPGARASRGRDRVGRGGEPEAAEMRCGGCGAKVGAEILARVLARVPATARGEGVLVGLDLPDDAAVVAVPPGKVAVQTVDFLRAFLDDPFLFGRLAANHALGDIYAMGAEPRTALAIVTLPFGGRGSMEEQLFQVLSGAASTLAEHGTALVGGHTGEGAELAAGFSVQGEVSPDRIWRKGGLRPGDALVLTKALGTGLVLAGWMRGRARSRWLDAAVASMAGSAAPAAACLAGHGVRACTDVTGFGLAGHLLEMLRAGGGLRATLCAGDIRWIDGARELAREGIRSSLHPENQRASVSVECAGGTPVPAEVRDLLHDPQTAGGLLAGVPGDQAGACVKALRLAGCPEASVIGRVGEVGPVGARILLE